MFLLVYVNEKKKWYEVLSSLITRGMYRTGFATSLVVGTLFVLRASSWFNAWVGLELNMLSFIPLVVKDKDILGAEAGIK